MNQCEQNHNADRSRVLVDIYNKYDGFIRSVIRFSARNQADREDIYQEVFLVLFQKSDLDQVQNLKSYLYRLVLNKSNEFLRNKLTREKKRNEYICRQIQKAAAGKEDMRGADFSDEVDIILELIRERLSERESEAVLLRFKHSYNNEEAARKMNVQKETLVHYVSVGLKKIREIIKSLRSAEKEGDNHEM